MFVFCFCLSKHSTSRSKLSVHVDMDKGIFFVSYSFKVLGKQWTC